MTPKEKALELISNYQADKIITYQRSAFSPIEEYELTDEEAKYCALICVDEIINELNFIQTACIDRDLDLVKRWKEVKQEIKKL